MRPGAELQLLAGQPAQWRPSHLSAPPWQWWNAHGYSVGAVGWADMELENSSEVFRYFTVGQMTGRVQPGLDGVAMDAAISTLRSQGSGPASS